MNKYTKSYPFWYYDNINFRIDNSDFIYLAHDLKYGYDYHIIGFLASWDHITNIIDDIAPTLKLELIQYERNRMILDKATELDLFSTPGGNVPENNGNNIIRNLGRAFVPFNYLLSNKDTLYMRVSGAKNINGIFEPGKVRLCTVGRNIITNG